MMSESLLTDHIEVNELGFSIKMIMCVCFLLFFLGININTDHGAVPSAAKPIKNDLDLNNQQFGTLGSMVFAGIVTGSLVAPFVFGRFKYKTILAVAFFINGLGLLAFMLVKHFYLVCISRLVSGFCQIFLTIFIPIYVDCFGTKNLKPYMMSLILLAGPLGVTIGYGATGYIVSLGISWRYAFLVLAIISGLSSILIVLMPDRYMNIEKCVELKRKTKNQRMNEIN